ncbi:unnamed protein product [Linum tenue]|uniref:Uncharacterized protein n=1 Tax=Linum tenue TaxID=586396 RepID=A0AAV0S898_9ROSI|nr:unnamed protein product [Linum tenue]CAI0629382.1 unnamed protein product [Linum tenue]
MLKFKALIFNVVHRQAAASTSTSPASTGQHLFTTGPPSPMWTIPPSRSTQAPSFNVSMGHVSFFAGGGGQAAGDGDFPDPPPVTGGTVGMLGMGTLGTVTGGSLGRWIGGSLIGPGPLEGDLGFGLGFRPPQRPQEERMGVAEERKSMKIRRRAAEDLEEDSIFGDYCSFFLWVNEGMWSGFGGSACVYI